MAENEGMEGKDLAVEEKKNFQEKVLEQIAKLKNGESKIIIGELEATKIGDQAILKVRGKSIAIVREKNIEYNLSNFEELKKELNEEGQTLDDLGLPELQDEIDKIQKQNSEKEETIDEPEQEKEVEQEGEGDEIDEEKDDEKPELEEDIDEKKEEIAKKYNVNSSQVIHISKDEKITENERFQGLVRWAQDRDDIYVIPGDNPYTYKFIGEKDGEQEEIESGTNKIIGGQNPDVTIKRIDGDKIQEIKPLAMYEVDSNTAIAIVRNEHGEPEALYCRQEAGHEKEFWGSVIPEASGKNVLQQDPKTREFMDHKYNSGLDLNNKADALTRQQDLEKRGLPSQKEGTQINEIEGNKEQNRSKNIDDVIEELMARDGVVDRATKPQGYYEYKAEKVVNLMDSNENITYEQAIEQVENEGQRDKGGRTRGEEHTDPRRG